MDGQTGSGTCNNQNHNNLEKKLGLAQRLVNRLPLCQDCRDKIPDRVCIECENQKLRQALEEIRNVIDNSWLTGLTETERYRRIEELVRRRTRHGHA